MTTEYPKEVQEAIKMARKMTRECIVKYFDEKIQYYKDYNTNNPTMNWAKDYPRLYAEEKREVLDEFDKDGVACWHKDYNHYGYGFDCEDINVYLYTDGTYKVSHYSYSAY